MGFRFQLEFFTDPETARLYLTIWTVSFCAEGCSSPVKVERFHGQSRTRKKKRKKKERNIQTKLFTNLTQACVMRRWREIRIFFFLVSSLSLRTFVFNLKKTHPHLPCTARPYHLQCHHCKSFSFFCSFFFFLEWTWSYREKDCEKGDSIFLLVGTWSWFLANDTQLCLHLDATCRVG